MNRRIPWPALACALLLAFALAAQVWLLQRPQPVAMEENGPLTLRRGQNGQELLLENLDPQQFRLEHAGRANAFVDVFCDEARLATETARELKQLLAANPPPAGPGIVAYTEETEGVTHRPGQETGATNLSITLAGKPETTASLRLLQKGAGDGDPYIELIPEGVSLRLQLAAAPPNSGDARAPGCRKKLTINRWDSMVNAFDIGLIVAPGSSVRIYFHPFPASVSLLDEAGWFAPFALGTASAGFRARAVGIRPQRESSDDAPAPFLLHARAVSAAPALALTDLRVGIGKMQAEFSGAAWLQKNGRSVGPDALAQARRRPLLAIGFVAIDGLLCGTLFVVLRGGSPRLLLRRGSRPRRASGERDLMRAVVTDTGENRPQPTPAERLKQKQAAGEFDVFLCHNSADKPMVREIGERLKERGLLPWMDEWDLRPGMPWQKALEEQIEGIHAAAVFVGDDGIGPWQEEELAAFLREFRQRGCPVIPVLLPDAPEKPELPIFLEGRTWVDFRRKEPDPLARLIWGITGQKPSEVR